MLTKLGHFKLLDSVMLKTSVIDNNTLLILNFETKDFFELDGHFAKLLKMVSPNMDFFEISESYLGKDELGAEEIELIKNFLIEMCELKIIEKLPHK